MTAHEIAHGKEFLVYLKLHCQAISQRCTATTFLGISSADLANPCVQLADGTEYSSLYLIDCQVGVPLNAAGQHCSKYVHEQETLTPEPTCAVHHGNVNKLVDVEVRFGLQRAAHKQQRALLCLQKHSTGLCPCQCCHQDSKSAPHTKGLCKGAWLDA